MSAITATRINRRADGDYFPVAKRESDMTSGKANKAAGPSRAALTAKLLLLFACLSLTLGFIATHAGLLPGGMTPIDPIVAWATTN
jgi:hypothetical protein